MKNTFRAFIHFFQELHVLFGKAHCPKCKVLQDDYAICLPCAETLQFKPEQLNPTEGGIPIWRLFTWNRRIQRIWYGVKFYKRYGHLFLIETAFKQAVFHMDFVNKDRPVWLVHPPFQAGKANIFAPFLAPLAKTQNWHYFSDAIAFNQTEDGVKSLHHSQSIAERQRLMQKRFTLNPPFLERLRHQKKHPYLIVVDDFMTTGTTLNACLRLLETAFQNAEERKDANHTICDKIESNQALLRAMVITTVPKTSAV